MKSFFPAFCVLAVGVAGVHADPVDSAIVAGMKLSESPNYSWTTTIDRGSQSAMVRGRTDNSGYSLVTFVGFAMASGGRASGSGNEIPAAFLGDSKYVVQTDGGWTSPGSLPAASDPSSSGSGSSTRNRGASGGGGTSGAGLSGGGMGGGGTGSSRRSGSHGSRNSSGGGQDSTIGGLPGLPTGINLPHEELAIIVANYIDMHVDGNIASGKLTETGADLLLVPPGSNETPPEELAGSFRLWITDGAVTKYEIKLSAKTGPGGKAVSGGFNETITVELKDVGSTSFEVPDAAKRRLGS